MWLRLSKFRLFCISGGFFTFVVLAYCTISIGSSSPAIRELPLRINFIVRRKELEQPNTKFNLTPTKAGWVAFKDMDVQVQKNGFGIGVTDDDDDYEDEDLSIGGARPPPNKRTFNSSTVEELILEVGAKIKDDTIRKMFTNCLPNTLDTTVYFHKKVKDPVRGLLLPYTYVITGDIKAMWLRDSSYQVHPYIPLAKHDLALRDLILGVINTQSEMIQLYEYGNAYFPLKHWDSGIEINVSTFAANDKVIPHYEKDEVYEAKYELDSLAGFLYLSKYYTEVTGDVRYLDNPHWISAVNLTLKTMRSQQNGTKELNAHGRAPYDFSRKAWTQSETTNLNGVGNPAKSCGLIQSFFRPSDDSTIFQYLIPANALAFVGLKGVAEILNQNLKYPELAEELMDLANEVELAIKKYGIVRHPEFGDVYAYEVDCYGSHIFMDDGNLPSLLTLPVFGFLRKDDRIYRNTRKYILNPDWNPYFSEGKFPGIGSPHTGLQKPWPMAFAMQAMTATDKNEIRKMLRSLRDSTAGTWFMHESIEVNDPRGYTRAWFAWANSVFGELILYLDKNYPEILSKDLGEAKLENSTT